MKILIIRFSSIGDIVLTTPVIRHLKTADEDYEVHYATKKIHSDLLAENPYLSRIHLLDRSLILLVRELRKERFDLIIDLHNNLRSRLVSLLLGVKTHRVDKLNFKKWLLVNFKINLLPNRHIVDRYMDTLTSLGIKSDQLGLDHFIPEKDEVESNWLPASHQHGFVAVVIGGKFATKRLPFERLIELCDRINRPIILLGGKEEATMGERIESFFKRTHDDPELEETLTDELGKRAQVFNGCGKFNLNQSASIIKQCQVVFTHDTGLMHIAAAFKKKVYSIWGNTVPEFGMYPYKTPFVIFENKKLNCRPCSKIGHNKCPKGHFNCMNQVTFDFYIPE